MARTESGISRAIRIAGNQAALARLIWEKCGVRIYQARVSDWERQGFVPKARAELVARVTGVPVRDLLRGNDRPYRQVAAP